MNLSAHSEVDVQEMCEREKMAFYEEQQELF